MAVNLTNADSVLKSYYLDVVTEQLDNFNPFFASIKKSTEDVYGKDVKKLISYGANGGIGAGTEDGNLPNASGGNYMQFTSTLKNLYGVIEVSDKAIRASENNSGAFVSILNAEMEGLINSSVFNFGRMLHGDGSGKLAMCVACSDGEIILDSAKNIKEGLVVDFRTESGELIEGGHGRKITKVNKENGAITVTGPEFDSEILPIGSIVTIQGSYQNEITGLGYLFDNAKNDLYGMQKNSCEYLTPFVGVFNTEDDSALQIAIDKIEERSGKSPNLIMCSWGVRRTLKKLLSAKQTTFTDSIELKGGYKAMSYNGIPVVVDRFCPRDTIYLLNTDDFVLHQLCDWQWLTDDDGRILKQVPGKPVYTATLVKYAELMCTRPCGQGVLTGVTES